MLRHLEVPNHSALVSKLELGSYHFLPGRGAICLVVSLCKPAKHECYTLCCLFIGKSSPCISCLSLHGFHEESTVCLWSQVANLFCPPPWHAQKNISPLLTTPNNSGLLPQTDGPLPVKNDSSLITWSLWQSPLPQGSACTRLNEWSSHSANIFNDLLGRLQLLMHVSKERTPNAAWQSSWPLQLRVKEGFTSTS